MSFLNRLTNVYDFRPDTSIPDLSSRVFVLTGGNAGLGLETALQLAKHSPKRLFLTARSRAKFDKALASITPHVPNAETFIEYVELDLSSFASVKAAAAQIVASTDRLDVLINNAGILGAPLGLTKDGYEIHFGTNHMGPALFTKLLLPLLLKTADQPRSDVRIVNLSSMANGFSPSAGIDFPVLNTDMSKTYGGPSGVMNRYGQSKLANNLHAIELANRYPNITSVSIHPGRVQTQLVDDLMATARFKTMYYVQKIYDSLVGVLSVQQGALNQTWAATAPREQLKNGAFYIPAGKLNEGPKLMRNKSLPAKLWDWQEEQFKAHGYA